MKKFLQSDLKTLKKGKKIYLNPLIVFINNNLSTSTNNPLLIISVPKKIGKSVLRNKIKRRIKNIILKEKVKFSCLIIVQKSEDYSFLILQKLILEFINKNKIKTQESLLSS